MPATLNSDGTLTYRTATDFRQRLLLSVISGIPIRIVDIYATDKDPGVSEEQYSLIEMLHKITNGTVFTVNKAGTNLYFHPGLLHGGDIEHDCCTDRGISYYLEVLVMLCLFCKAPLKATLRGVTSTIIDSSVDHIKASLIPMLKRFVEDDEGIDLKITKRGMSPNGGGEVIFTCPVMKKFKPIKLLETGTVERIRGTAYALRTLPTTADRLVDSAEIILSTYYPDVQINVDLCTGRRAGRSPGYGIYLYAETSNGLIYSSEAVSVEMMEGSEPCMPENLGINAAERLCHHIHTGGCNDPATQSLAIIYMALGLRTVSKLVISTITSSSRSLLNYLRDFFDIMFTLETAPLDEYPPNADKILLGCIGIGYLSNSI